MIYVDTSVLLAELLAEDRAPPASLWNQDLVSSRMAEYEAWVRVHRLGFAETHGETLRELLSQLAMLELSPLVLSRALEPFPVSVRTLDALHLASIEYLRAQRLDVALATYDERMGTAASGLGIDLEAL